MKLDLSYDRIHFEAEGRQGGIQGNGLKFVQSYCPCGGVILADTEDWEVPLYNECYEALGEPATEPGMNSSPS